MRDIFGNEHVTDKMCLNVLKSIFDVQQEIIGCSDYIKMVQKPRKIKAFRGFLIPKRADIVCPHLT